MKIICNLCDSLNPFDTDDPDLINRVKAHENKHNRTTLPSERDGSPKNNSTKQGNVEWITI